MRAALGQPLTHKAQNCQQQSLAAPMLISVLWAHGLAFRQFVYDGLDQIAQFGAEDRWPKAWAEAYVERATLDMMDGLERMLDEGGIDVDS